MKKLKLYIETSVWNFLFVDDAPDKMHETWRFFDVVKSDDYVLYISELVISEMERAPENIKRKLLGKIAEFEPEELKITEEIGELALKYADFKMVPEKEFRDLVHLAIATVNNMDFIISWNLAHIVRMKTKLGINMVNAMEGYRDLKICTVTEVP